MRAFPPLAVEAVAVSPLVTAGPWRARHLRVRGPEPAGFVHARRAAARARTIMDRSSTSSGMKYGVTMQISRSACWIMATIPS